MEAIIDALKFLIVKDQIEPNNRDKFTFEDYLKSFKKSTEAQELIKTLVEGNILFDTNSNSTILNLLFLFIEKKYRDENLETFIKRSILSRRDYFDQESLNKIVNTPL